MIVADVYVEIHCDRQWRDVPIRACSYAELRRNNEHLSGQQVVCLLHRGQVWPAHSKRYSKEHELWPFHYDSVYPQEVVIGNSA